MEKPSKARLATALLLPALGLAAGCGGSSSSHDWSALADDPSQASLSVTPAAAGHRKAPVDPTKPLVVKATHGQSISDVTAVDGHGRILDGTLDHAGTTWRSTGGLAAGDTYTVRVATTDEDNHPGTRTLRFSTSAPKNVLKADVQPKNGATVGVGQPVAVSLSKPVKSARGRRAVERGLTVTSTPQVTGSWYWVDSKTLHYRPREYWPAGTKVTLREHLGGVRVEDGLYGEPGRTTRFTVGDRLVATANGATHTMTVRINGKVAKIMPVTMGKPGYATRTGVKVVLQKQSFVRMKSSTVGIAAGSADSYDLPVHWATRVTWSGEYVHAAPWSVGKQGVTNSSHGCVGMSTDNAKWLFDHVRAGDVVDVVGGGGHRMEPFGNGFGDWNVTWKAWQKGSALTGGGTNGTGPTHGTGALQPVDYLRPQL